MTKRPSMLVLGIALLALAGFLASGGMQAQHRSEQARDMARAHTIMNVHCVSCHAANPTDPTVDGPPNGLVLQTDGQLLENAPGIYDQVWVAKTMPPGNLTNLSDSDRAFLGQWAKAAWAQRDRQHDQDTSGE